MIRASIAMSAGALLLLPRFALADELLPLKHGYYVSLAAPCEEASNATLSLYLGKNVNISAHEKCTVVEQKAENDGWYAIKERCIDLQDYRDPPHKYFRTVNYKIVSDTEFIMKLWVKWDGKPKLFENIMRYCSQSSLPGPWNTIDLSNVRQ